MGAAIALAAGIVVVIGWAAYAREPTQEPTPSAQDSLAQLASNQPSEKDLWDIIDAISGISVAIVGAVATYVFNRQRQHAEDSRSTEAEAAEDARASRHVEVLQVQAVQALFPHLLSTDEREKHLGLRAMDALGNPLLASKLAEVIGGRGSIEALTEIAQSEENAVAAGARESLGRVFRSWQSRVVRLSLDSGFASGFLVSYSGVIVTVSNAAPEPDIEVNVEFLSGTPMSASCEWTSMEVGLSILRLHDPSVDFDLVPINPADEASVVRTDVVTLRYGQQGWIGTTSYVAGFANRFTVSELVTLEYGALVTAHAISEQGDAGAPVVDKNGHLVGVVWGGATGAGGYTLIVPVSAIEHALREARQGGLVQQ